MINGSVGLNVRVLGVSRDMTMQAAVPLGGRYMLIQDDPALVAQAKAAGFVTIYRQSGDDTDHNVLATDPVQFVQTRAEKGADHVHLTNEVASSSALHQWTRRALEYATSIGVKCCAYNYATNASAVEWQAARPNLAYAVSHGHCVGFHQYPDGQHDDGGLAWRDTKHAVGGTWLCTEFNYCRDIVSQAEHGWRGKLSQAELIAFFAKWLPTFAAENVPVLTFSFDDWRPNADGKANGFGVHDATDFLQGLAALNVKYPIQEHPVNPTPAPIDPPTTSLGLFTLTTCPGAFVNVRAQPNVASADIGDLPKGETVTLYAPDSNGWVYVRPLSGVSGWVSRQSGKVVFTPTTIPTPTPPTAIASIIDVSQYNGTMDWQKIKAAGVKTAIIRATIGITGLDSTFLTNVQGTALAGISAGYYHVFLPHLDPAAQAQSYYDAIKAFSWWLTPFVDVELAGAADGTNTQTPQQIADALLIFMRKFETLAGQKPGIYTASWFWNPRVGNAHDAEFAKCLLWVAQYDALQPSIPRGWCNYALWQWSSSGVIDGNGSSHVDLNRLP